MQNLNQFKRDAEHLFHKLNIQYFPIDVASVINSLGGKVLWTNDRSIDYECEVVSSQKFLITVHNMRKEESNRIILASALAFAITECNILNTEIEPCIKNLNIDDNQYYEKRKNYNLWGRCFLIPEYELKKQLEKRLSIKELSKIFGVLSAEMHDHLEFLNLNVAYTC